RKWWTPGSFGSRSSCSSTRSLTRPRVVERRALAAASGQHEAADRVTRGEGSETPGDVVVPVRVRQRCEHEQDDRRDEQERSESEVHARDVRRGGADSSGRYAGEAVTRVLVLLGLLAFASPALGGGPAMSVGAAEDIAEQPDY